MKPKWKAPFSDIQDKLYGELACSFNVPSSQRGYLSDGGHFENLAGYELIRRHNPLIVIIDAEQDENYKFDGLLRLIRKARADFGAEIKFFNAAELANPSSVDPERLPPSLEDRFLALPGNLLTGVFCQVDKLKPSAQEDGKPPCSAAR